MSDPADSSDSADSVDSADPARRPTAGERISDPRRVRALAHPLRLTLLDLLGDGELTATQCSQATGESPANCSFHLRNLAKYGYVVPGERRGKEKPWKLAARSREIRPDHGDPESIRAVAAIAAVALDREVERVRAWIDRAGVEDPAWVDSSTINTSTTWATLEEYEEISDVLRHLADRFAGRNEDPQLRPPGARPIRILSVNAVDVEREERAPNRGAGPTTDGAQR
jgi:DNA-binding transcriptional ArsR family regulator